jgi:hypothetical protein
MSVRRSSLEGEKDTMSLLHRLKRDRYRASVSAGEQGEYQTTFVEDGNLHYAVEKGENSEEPSYQEVSGAPVESRSPLGYHVGAVTIVSNVGWLAQTGANSARPS